MPRFEPLLESLYAAPIEPVRWTDFMGNLSALTGVSKAALIAHDVSDGKHTIVATLGASVVESIPLYERHYWQFDEWAARFPRVNSEHSFLVGERVWSEYEFRESVFFNEFLKNFDVCQMAGLTGARGQGWFDALSVFRGPSESPFSAEVIETLNTLVPHLKTALHTRRRLLSLESRVSDLESSLDRLPVPVILVNRRGRCIFLNQTAYAILGMRSGLILRRAL